MKRLALLLPLAASLAACGSGSGGPDDGAVCAHDLSAPRVPDFEVTAGTTPTVVRRDVDMAGMQRLNGAETVGGKLQGLTEVEHRFGYRTQIALKPRLFKEKSCAWLEKVTVDLTPSEVTIFVPKEYDPDSCEYEEIMTHERQHEEIHRRLLQDEAADMRRALAKADYLPARGTPLAVYNRAEADARVEAMIEKNLRPSYAAFKEALAKENAVIDMPDNYKWTSLRCAHWK